MEVKVPNHTHIKEIRVWIGFAVALLIAFLVTILAPGGMTGEQVETVWIVAISAVFINHGIWDRRERIMILWGSLSIAAVLVSLALLPTLYPIGWVILGCGIAFSGFYPAVKMDGFVGIYITLGVSSGCFWSIFRQQLGRWNFYGWCWLV
jgi:high-affinity Fe2+/Pb2+ permease